MELLQAGSATKSANEVRGLSADDVFVDPLAGCLDFLARYYDRAVPVTALVAGLPLVDGKLTPGLFARAAARAGLSAKVVRRPLDQLPAALLPAVLLLSGDQALVLVARDDAAGRARIIVPDTGLGEVSVTIDELAERYTGYAILTKPEYQFSGSQDRISKSTRKDWFWSAVTPLWPTYAQVIGAAAIVNILALAAPLFILNVYDRVLPNLVMSTLWVLAIGMGAAITFDLILKTVRGALIGNAGRRADIVLASRMFEHVLRLDLGQRPMRTGEFANQLRDFEFVREFFTSNTLVTLTDFLFIWLFIFIIYQIAGIVAIIPAVAVVLVIIAGLVLQGPLRKVVARAQAEGTHRHSLLIEALTGLETIKCARAESQFQRQWEQFVAQNARTAEDMRSVSSFGLNFTSFCQQFVTVGVIIVGVYQFDAGEVTPGAIIAAVILASRAVAPLGQIASTIARAQQAFQSLTILNGIMAVAEEAEGDERQIDRTIGSGAVEFDQVSFTYPGADMPALSKLSLRIAPGERVGVVGRIGSGKTTLGRLIARLYVPTEGRLLLDGVEIRQYYPSEVRRRVALVSQDTSLFNGSVRDNIVLGAPHVGDDLVLEAARLAGVTDFVARHPKGFNMPVGEGGRFLSSGQRQAVTLARALLFDPAIVFLDEPSGAMDMASERALVMRLRRAFRTDQTVIIATHRTAMLSLVERLVVLDQGAVAADGPRDVILKQLAGAAPDAASGAAAGSGATGRVQPLQRPARPAQPAPQPRAPAEPQATAEPLPRKPAMSEPPTRS